MFIFEITKKAKPRTKGAPFGAGDDKSRARTGVIHTAHGDIKTPVFMPVATCGAIKGLSANEMKEIGADILLSNTYHLWLRPGHKIVKKFGGLHKFSGWRGPIITDSGGFQAFSLGYGMEEKVGKILIKTRTVLVNVNKDRPCLGKLAKITEEGVSFKSHLDGSPLFLTPELSMEIQHALGSDIILTLDECTSPLASYEYTRESLERSHRWEDRCLKAHQKLNKKNKTNLALFGIIQGGKFADLRKKAVDYVNSREFDGFAIGGSFGDSYGQTKKEMWKILDSVIPFLNQEKPRHLLGIGGIDDLFECVERGVDMFDCVSPTRLARQGMLFVGPKSGGNAKNKWRIHIKNEQYKTDKKPVDADCKCEVCQNYSRGYLNHLLKSNELLGLVLATKHNLYFILDLMRQIRESIEKGKFQEFKKKWRI